MCFVLKKNNHRRAIALHWGVGAALVVLALVLRFFSFFPSVIDHDESTYLVMANSMLQHCTLYVDMIDIKPPGIFLLYAAQLWLCKSVFFTRIITALVVALTAYALYWHRWRWSGGAGRRSAVAAGVVYVVLTSVYSFYGVSPNTELYFNFFTAVGLCCFLQPRVWSYALGGLLMGVGFMIKYMVLFDFLAIGCWTLLLLLQPLPPQQWLRATLTWLPKAVVAAVCFALPFALCHVYYYAIGEWQAYHYITYIVPRNYADSWHLANMLQLVGDYYLRFLPITLMALYASMHTPKQAERWLAVIWTLAALVAVTLPGNRFGHYTIQLMLPTAWIAGAFWEQNMPRPQWLQAVMQHPALRYIAAATLIALVWLQKRDCYDPADLAAQTAAYLNEHLEPNQTIYTANTQHIVYLLTNRNSPIPYVHRGLIFDKNHIKNLQIDTTQQINQLIAQAPTYIVLRDSLPAPRLQRFVTQQYQHVHTIDNQIQIWRHR